MKKYYYNPVSDLIEQSPILDYNNINLFPEVGNETYLYIDRSTGFLYKWINNQYILLNNYRYTGTTTKEVGGIKSEITVLNKGVEGILRAMLSPESISDFSISGANLKSLTKLEVGESITIGNTSSTMTFNVTPAKEEVTKVRIRYEGRAGEAVTRNVTTNITLPNTYTLGGSSVGGVAAHYSEVPGYISFTALREDEIGQEYSKEIKYEWVYRSIVFTNTFSGSSNIANDNLDSIPLTGRVFITESNTLEKVKRIVTSNSTAPQFIYILLPTTYSEIVELRSNGIGVPFIKRTGIYSETVTVSGRAFEVGYRVYRTSNAIAGSIVIDIV